MNYTSLSKEISYALRHAPHEYGLCLDEQGWVSVEVLVSILKKQEKFNTLSVDDIEKMIYQSEKKRHQMLDGKIRALYGHSLNEKVVKEPVKPPNTLYHGTARKFVENILTVGLISKDRQYVHLSEDVSTATVVGKRRDGNPVVLRINAEQAWADGIKFYHGNEDIWLADNIPIEYISLQ